MRNDEIRRMNLAGMDPRLRQRIRDECARVLREFDGQPEHVAEFVAAQELWPVLEDIELAELDAEARRRGMHVWRSNPSGSDCLCPVSYNAVLPRGRHAGMAETLWAPTVAELAAQLEGRDEWRARRPKHTEMALGGASAGKTHPRGTA